MSYHPGSRLFEVVLEDGRAEVRFINAFLDERNSEAMQAEVSDLLDRLSNRQVYFDLGNIEFVSSSWLGLFVLLFRGLRSAGGRMILHHVDPEVYEVFRATRLTDLLEVREKDPGPQEKVLSSEF
jgi:anti-anti-sigma factor